MARLSWQRCAACGRLVLVRFGTAPDCSCAKLGGVAPRGRQADPPLAGRRADCKPAPEPPSSPIALLTPEQDAVARRLLGQALPDGFDL
jgi:hypothetical protein